MFRFRYLAYGTPLVAAASMLAVTPAPAQNATGQTMFNQRCKACHSVTAGDVSTAGPNLRGVVGRKAGTAKFAYSAAMRNSKLVLTKAVLEKYLAAPAQTVPGTKMVVSVSDAAQRTAIINYLATQR